MKTYRPSTYLSDVRNIRFSILQSYKPFTSNATLFAKLICIILISSDMKSIRGSECIRVNNFNNLQQKRYKLLYIQRKQDGSLNGRCTSFWGWSIHKNVLSKCNTHTYNCVYTRTSCTLVEIKWYSQVLFKTESHHV